MNTALLILLISAATLTASVGNAAPQSAELARLILQALEMNKANTEQSDIISAVSRLQEEEQNAANNPYKNFKPPEDHKLPSNGEQGATGSGQFFLPPPVFPIVPITVTSYEGTLVSVEKIIKPEGERIWLIFMSPNYHSMLALQVMSSVIGIRQFKFLCQYVIPVSGTTVLLQSSLLA